MTRGAAFTFKDNKDEPGRLSLFLEREEWASTKRHSVKVNGYVGSAVLVIPGAHLHLDLTKFIDVRVAAGKVVSGEAIGTVVVTNRVHGKVEQHRRTVGFAWTITPSTS